MPSYKLAESFIDKLRGAGIEPTYQQFVEFQDLAHKGCAPMDGPLALMMGRRIGNKTYYPLTLGASIWYSDCAAEWFSDSDELLALALLYAMANAYDLDKLRDMESKRKARRVLRMWGMSVTMTTEQATELMSEMLAGVGGDNKEEEGESMAADYGVAVRVLQRFYGQTREHWLNEPADHCEALIRDAIKANSDPDAPPDANDPGIRAFYYMNELYYQILEAADNG